MIQIKTRGDVGLGIELASTPSLGNHFAKTASYTILAGEADSGKTFSNKGAGGAVIFTLPVAKAGMHFRFAKLAAQNLTVTATGGAKINGGSANGSLANTTGGDSGTAFVHLWSPDGVDWFLHASVGTWA